MELAFTKMQGIGNDFVVADCLLSGAPSPDQIQAASVRLCDRKFGIGGDGVLLILPSQSADFTMRMFNPDGSESEMCGNGIRCFAKYVFDRGYTDKRTITVETGAGVLTLELEVTDGKVGQVRVDMGPPYLERSEIPMAAGAPGRVVAEEVTVAGEKLAITAVSMGNPHAVFFVAPATDDLINSLGPVLEKHEQFPRRTNVHAVEVLGRGEVRMLTWERGAGRTLACGTGACAVAVASALNGKTDRKVLAHLPGGDLLIEWSDADNHVYMTGPAAEVFDGTIRLDAA